MEARVSDVRLISSRNRPSYHTRSMQLLLYSYTGVEDESTSIAVTRFHGNVVYPTSPPSFNRYLWATNNANAPMLLRSAPTGLSYCTCACISLAIWSWTAGYLTLLNCQMTGGHEHDCRRRHRFAPPTFIDPFSSCCSPADLFGLE